MKNRIISISKAGQAKAKGGAHPERNPRHGRHGLQSHSVHPSGSIVSTCTEHYKLMYECKFEMYMYFRIRSIKIFGIWPNAHTRLAMQSRWCGARSGLSQLDLPIICSDEMLSEFVFHYGFKMCLVFPSYIWSSSVYQDDYTVFSMSPT